MRSFAGRDILSLKDFERNEFFRVFDVCDELRPHAANRKNGRPHHRGKQQQHRQKGGHGHHNARPQPHHAEQGKGEPNGLGNVTFLHRSGEPRRNAGNR